MVILIIWCTQFLLDFKTARIHIGNVFWLSVNYVIKYSAYYFKHNIWSAKCTGTEIQYVIFSKSNDKRIKAYPNSRVGRTAPWCGDVFYNVVA